MLIKEVENNLSLSRKSIRYYEQVGLLNPKRNQENDYRTYNNEDIKTLEKIKFLRELNVPIQDIKKMQDGSLTLEECMQDRIKKIEEEQKNYQLLKNMCTEIEISKENYHSINITNYSKQMNILNKKGFTMRDVNTNKKKRIYGAITSSLIFSLFFIFLIAIITYFQLTEKEQIPWILYSFLIFIFIIPLISVLINLIERIREIKKGEEDEASKY